MGEISSRPSPGRYRLRRLGTKALPGPEVAEAHPGPASLLAMALWFGAVTGLAGTGPGPPPQADLQHPHPRDVAEESAFRLDDPRVEPADLREPGPPDRPRRPTPAEADLPARLLSARVRRIAGPAAPHPATLPARLYPPGLRGDVLGRPAVRSPRAGIPARRPPQPAGAPHRRGGADRPGLPPRGLGGAPGVGGSPGGHPRQPQRADDRARHGPRRSPEPLRLSPRYVPQPDAPGRPGGPVRAGAIDGPLDAPLARQHVHRPMAPRAFRADRTPPRRDLSDAGRSPLPEGLRRRRLRRQHPQLQRLVRPRSGVRPLRGLLPEYRGLDDRNPLQLLARPAPGQVRPGAGESSDSSGEGARTPPARTPR